jgi:hypothetical protein
MLQRAAQQHPPQRFRGASGRVNIVLTFLVAAIAGLITPECILTPLIPVYLATILCWPTSTRRRALAVAVAPLLFFSLGVARLLVLALPASLAVHTIALHAFYQVALAVALVGLTVWLTLQGNQPAGRMWRRAAGALSFGIAAAALSAAAIGVAVPLLTAAFGDILRHLGHGYVDGQGALTILPAAQVGLFVALWVASGTSGKSARVATGIGALAIQQLGVALVLGELHTHAGFELPIVAIRAGAIVVPVILVWLLRRDRPLRGNALTVAGVALSG